MKFHIGCSGFMYDDWIGNFYPRGMDTRYFFNYYARFFNTTEINSTFYSLPGKDTIKTWIKKSTIFPDFKFSFKYPQSVTHSNYALTGRAIDDALEFQRKVLEPFKNLNRLGSALIQLAPNSDPDKDSSILLKLSDLLNALSTSHVNNSLEIRSPHFLKGDNINALLKILEDNNVALVSIDSPIMSPFYYPTAEFSYVRFHGRNRDIWFKYEAEDGRLNRYDYLYSAEELLPWVDFVKRMNGDVFIYFNNHAYAKAAKNAMEFAKMLGVSFDTKNYNQKDLSSFNLDME